MNHFVANENIGNNYGQRLTTFYRVRLKLSYPEEGVWEVKKGVNLLICQITRGRDGQFLALVS